MWVEERIIPCLFLWLPWRELLGLPGARKGGEKERRAGLAKREFRKIHAGSFGAGVSSRLSRGRPMASPPGPRLRPHQDVLTHARRACRKRRQPSRILSASLFCYSCQADAAAPGSFPTPLHRPRLSPSQRPSVSGGAEECE